MEPGKSKWSVGNPNGAWEIQMKLGTSKWSLGGQNEAWGSKWSVIESHVISFNKNDVQM